MTTDVTSKTAGSGSIKTEGYKLYYMHNVLTKKKLIQSINGYRGFNVKHKNARGLKETGLNGVVKGLRGNEGE